MVIVISRLGSKVEIKTKAESVENAAGELVSVREEASQSQQTVITEAEIKGGVEINPDATASHGRIRFVSQG